MGWLDKAKGAIKGRSAMVEKGVDAAARQVNQRTGGKYAGKVQEQAAKLKAQARQLDDERPVGTGLAGDRTPTADGGYGRPGGVAEGPAPTTPGEATPGGTAARRPDDPYEGPTIG